jgi:hypothetical protein
MKRTVPWIAVALVALACKAGEPAAAAVAPAGDPGAVTDARPTGPAGKAACEQPNHDFGTVTEGEAVKHTFVVKNVGDGVLHILSARGG